MRHKNKNDLPRLPRGKADGFSLIELMVVVAIIALLSSVALIAFLSARQKARDAKRVADMVQMNNALELYFSGLKGYPSGPAGLPSPLVPSALVALPNAPQPADGGCEAIDYHSFNSAVPVNTFATGYYYYPSGPSYLGADGITVVYPDYAYQFCLGATTGNLPPGQHQLTPKGLR